MSVRIAAVGDVHAGADSVAAIAGAMVAVNEDAHLLLLAGDLTRNGGPDEARVLVRELSDVRIPIVAVLGNHDYHQDRDREIAAILNDRGITVIMVTHEPDIAAYAKRNVVMRDGLVLTDSVVAGRRSAADEQARME